MRHRTFMVAFYPPATTGLHWQSRCRACSFRGDPTPALPGDDDAFVQARRHGLAHEESSDADWALLLSWLGR